MMTVIGIIEAVDSSSRPSRDAGLIFQLGLMKGSFRFCAEPSRFDAYFEAMETVNQQWSRTMDDMDDTKADFPTFCQRARETIVKASVASNAFFLKAQGYCFDFAHRKFVIGEAVRRKGNVDWSASNMQDIQSISADAGEYLQEIPAQVVSVSFSYAVLCRADWAVMLSCFACLWSEVMAKLVDTGVLGMSALIKLVISDELAANAVEYRQTHGISATPYVLIEDYLQEDRGIDPKKKRRRRA
jgi:hypothetical protein